MPRPTAGWAVVTAALSPALMTAGWLIADSQQPADYSPVRQSISVLAGRGGTDSWIMTGALIAVGCCHLLTASGLGGAPRPARVFLALTGLMSIAVALRPEPVHGSTVGHIVCTIAGAVLLATWPALLAACRARDSIPLSARGATTVTIGFVALAVWLAVETRVGAMLGLAERVFGSIETAWPLVVVLALRRREVDRARSPVPPVRVSHAD